jgi:Putative zinc-finger
MLWLSKHARLRDKLSPYLDGRLTSAEIKSLEGHLVSCEECRRALDELRATVSAVRELPEVEAPKSFALTPAMLARKTPTLPSRPVPSFGVGMRLAGAAVAVALTVVVVGDLTFAGSDGGVGDEAGSQPASDSRTAAELDSGFNAEKSADDGAAQGYAAPTSAAGAAGSASCPSAAGTTGSEAGGAGAGGAAAAGGSSETLPSTATAEPGPQATPPSPGPGAAAACADVLANRDAAAPVAPQTTSPAEPGTPENEMATRATSDSGDDSGISTIRVAEIALGALLVLLLAGIVIETAKRRRTIH